MRLPTKGQVKCPKTGKMVDVLECYAHCLSCAENPKYRVCLEDMTLEEIDEDVRKTHTKEELEEE